MACCTSGGLITNVLPFIDNMHLGSILRFQRFSCLFYLWYLLVHRSCSFIFFVIIVCRIMVVKYNKCNFHQYFCCILSYRVCSLNAFV